MEPRRRSLQKRRIQSEYVSKASPLKISFTPSTGECNSPLSSSIVDSSAPSKEELEPPEVARKHTADTNEIYPSATQDALGNFLQIDPTSNQFSTTPLPSSPGWREDYNQSATILDHTPVVRTQTDLQGIDHEVDMSTSSSSLWTTHPLLDHLTPPPSRDRGNSQKSAFARAAEVYESFHIGLETPETPSGLSLEHTMGDWSMRDFKRQRTRLENDEAMSQVLATSSSTTAEATPLEDMDIQQLRSDANPESIHELEDELANTSLVEEEQLDLSMEQELDQEFNLEQELEPDQDQYEDQSMRQSSVFSVPDQSLRVELELTIEKPVRRRPGRPKLEHTKASRGRTPAVNEMTVVASAVGEVLMETMKATASESENRAGVKLFKKQAETMFVEQMNLWSENEELQKDRRLEIAKGRRLRARLLDIRTKRQTVQAEIEHERSLYQADQNSTKESQGLQDLLDGIQSLKTRVKQSDPDSCKVTDKHRVTLQGVVKSVTARCGTIDDDGHRQGGLLQLIRDFNQKLELWNHQLEDERKCA